MRKARFSEAKIIEALKQAEGGVKVDEVCRQHGISRNTFYAWRKKYGGLTVSEQIIGNYIDPRMQGHRLHISPVVVLASLVFWTWVWGPIGSLLSVPVTVALLAAASRSERLRPLAQLASAESRDHTTGYRDRAA